MQRTAERENTTACRSPKISYTVPEAGGRRSIHQMKAEILLYSNLESNLSGNVVNIIIVYDLCEISASRTGFSSDIAFFDTFNVDLRSNKPHQSIFQTILHK